MKLHNNIKLLITHHKNKRETKKKLLQIYKCASPRVFALLAAQPKTIEIYFNRRTDTHKLNESTNKTIPSQNLIPKTQE